ncbi:hypothetical protein [Kitasatospora sp. NPDC094015]|uniref:hypothetical protein n=1 Tax=Kitasatospora sp. NPDC094015 TaxID=3155205 RepID=UPI0033222736
MSRSYRFVPSLATAAATLALVACGAAATGAVGALATPSTHVSVTADGAGSTAAPGTTTPAPEPTVGPGSNGWW